MNQLLPKRRADSSACLREAYTMKYYIKYYIKSRTETILDKRYKN